MAQKMPAVDISDVDFVSRCLFSSFMFDERKMFDMVFDLLFKSSQLSARSKRYKCTTSIPSK